MKMTRELKIDLFANLGNYLLSANPELESLKLQAQQKNSWFIPPFVSLAIENIGRAFLQKEKLENWLAQYPERENHSPKDIGVVMAGNIPAVGFHDLMCILFSGHIASVKLSSKDEVLIRHFVEKLISWDPSLERYVKFREMLKGCDAYIATGSNNSARYFHEYFGKYPHIIRKNRTAMAILDGNESKNELEKLSDDVFQYFGLGCRNVTKLLVPKDYDFTLLLETFKRYAWLKDNHHYINNFDYNLSLVLLNKETFISNEMVLLLERSSPFSSISVLHYEKYEGVKPNLQQDENLQCIIGHGYLPFGSAQQPSLDDYADGMDTMQFLTNL